MQTGKHGIRSPAPLITYVIFEWSSVGVCVTYQLQTPEASSRIRQNINFPNFDISLVIAIMPSFTFLDLSSAKLNTDQVTAILKAVRNNNIVEELALSGVDLSGVSLQIVKESISNLKKIIMHMNYLDKMLNLSERVSLSRLLTIKEHCSHIFHIQVL